ncbi:MAG TPA: hypothetical protein VHQ47_18265 [Phycisphaerae bacterium]|nr:hypothetical protein [Phycisphaerae bacterium]
MRRHPSFIAATLFLTAVANAADPLPAPQPAAETTDFLTPYLDQSTLLVAHVDLARLDFPAAVQFLEQEIAATRAPLLTGPIKDLGVFRAQAKTLLAQAQNLGARHLYFFLDQSAGAPDPSSFVLLIPLDNSTDPAPLLDLLQSLNLPNLQTASRGHTLALGTPKGLAHLAHIVPSPRPDLLAAFTPLPHHDPAPLTIACSMAGDFRRTLLDSRLMLPPQLGGAPAATLFAPIRSAALGLDTNPDPSLTLILTTDDRDAAAHLAGVLKDDLTIFSKSLVAEAQQRKDPLIAQQIPTLQQLPQLLAPTAIDRTVSISLDKKALSQLTAALIAPSLSQARRMALRTKSMSNMRQIATAAIVTADQNGEMPDTLDQLQLPTQTTTSPEPFKDTSYTYFPWSSADLEKLNTSETPVVWDHGDTPDDGITIAFADGHAEHFHDPDQLNQFLQAAEETLDNPKPPQ